MITLHAAHLKAHILPRGATLAGVWLGDRPRSLTLGYARPMDYEADPFYMGALVGPIANRLGGACLEIAGMPWHLPPNEGRSLLHSGTRGLHARIWQVSAQEPHAVTLTLDLAHGEDGLPGARRICAHYALTDPPSMTLTLSATTDRETVVNIAHHPYWTLDDEVTVAAHRLQVSADEYLPVTEENLPTGLVADVAGTGYDFRTEAQVPTDRVLDANLCVARQRGKTPREVARLTGASGISLRIASTEPGLQVYNGIGLVDRGAPMLCGQPLKPCAGIALEPQSWPDAPNHPSFPGITISPTRPYRQVTVYRFFE